MIEGKSKTVWFGMVILLMFIPREFVGKNDLSPLTSLLDDEPCSVSPSRNTQAVYPSCFESVYALNALLSIHNKSTAKGSTFDK